MDLWTKIVDDLGTGKADTAKRLIQANPTVLNERSPNGETLLHLAAKKNLPDMVEFFLSQGLDPNAKDDFGWSPVHEAAVLEDETILVKLLKKKGNPNLTSAKKETPLHLACRKGLRKTIQVLLKNNAGTKFATVDGLLALHEAVLSGDVEAIKLVLIDDPNINQTTKAGDTPLHLAAQNGRIQAAQFLIAQGADTQRFNQAHQTYLEMAEAWHQPKFLEVFRDGKKPEEVLPPKTRSGEPTIVRHAAESVVNEISHFVYPFIQYWGMAFIMVFVFLHLANFCVAGMLTDQTSMLTQSAAPGTVSSQSRFMFMFYKGRGILGTDVPLTWWFFNGAIMLAFLQKTARVPREKFIIYFSVIMLLILHLAIPAPNPMVDMLTGSGGAPSLPGGESASLLKGVTRVLERVLPSGS